MKSTMHTAVLHPELACHVGCGREATRPAVKPYLCETDYRRRLRLGLPEGAVPPPADPAEKGGRRPVPAPEPAVLPPDEHATAADTEAARRIKFEVTRAAAFTRAYLQKDHRGMDAVRSQVMHGDAFDALVEADLDVAAARTDLAGQIRAQFPEPQPEAEEAAA